MIRTTSTGILNHHSWRVGMQAEGGVVGVCAAATRHVPMQPPPPRRASSVPLRPARDNVGSQFAIYTTRISLS